MVFGWHTNISKNNIISKNPKMGRWDDCLSDQESDGPRIILID